MSLTQNRNAPQQNKLIVTTAVPVDDQFSNLKQVRWSGASLLLANAGNQAFHFRLPNLSFNSKFCGMITSPNNYAGDSDGINIYTASYGTAGNVRKRDLTGTLIATSGTIKRIISLCATDPDYLFATTTDTDVGNGIYMIKKSDLSVVTSIRATGSGGGQFTSPTGLFYIAASKKLYVCDATRVIVLDVVTDTGLEAITWNTSYAIAASDLCFDGTNWFVQSATDTYKYDNVFTDATRVSTACVGYSLTIIPDQGDGNGATLAISNNSGNCLYRRKCSDLSLVATVGSAGDGSASLFDPVITGPAGIWRDSEGGQYAVASSANISKNGFSGDFFRGAPNRMTYQPTGKLSDITAIDFNADAIVGEIKNLYKCVNLTSCKLQTNPLLSLDLSRMSAKLTTLWAYACGAGVRGSIRHMTALTSVNLRENGASQAQVDQWIGDLYANKDIMTPGTANFNGSNTAPSAAGKAQADELIGTYGWTIAYS